MKKFFALMLVLSLVLVAGSAFAATKVGHNENANKSATKDNGTTEKVTVVVVKQLVVTGTKTVKVFKPAGELLAALKAAIASLVRDLAKDFNVSAVDPDEAAQDGAKRLAELAERDDSFKGYVPAHVLPPMRPKKSGPAKILLPTFDKKLWGKKPMVNLFGTRVAAAGFFAAANEDGVSFATSKDKPTEVIPETDGILKISADLDANTEYAPIVAISSKDVTDAFGAAAFVSEDETINTYTEMEVAVWDGARINVDPSLVGSQGFVMISGDIKVSGDVAAFDETLAKTAKERNEVYLAGLPIIVSSSDKEYDVVLGIDLKMAADVRKTVTDDAKFVFYPNYPETKDVIKSAAVTNPMWKQSGDKLVAMKASELKSGAEEGYLAFTVPAKGTLANPVLVVAMSGDKGGDGDKNSTVTGTFGIAISPASQTVRAGEENTARVTSHDNAGAVTLNLASGAPSWVTLSGAVLNYAPEETIAAGTYTAHVNATDAEGHTSSADATIVVTAAAGPESFTLSLTGAPSSVKIGGTATATLTPKNANGTVSVTVTDNGGAAGWVSLSKSSGIASDEAVTVTFAPKSGVSEGSHTIVFTGTDSGTTPAEARATVAITFDVTYADVNTGEGGGCTAGFGALALAVLGAFIARKK